MTKRMIVRSGAVKKNEGFAKRETDSLAILSLLRSGIVNTAARLPITCECPDAVKRDLADILELCYATAKIHGISEGELNHARVKMRHDEGTYDDAWTM